MLRHRLEEKGHALALFHGGLTRLAKESAIAAFRGPARILLTTDAGSEGRNLQFAHAVCNFDLPWNPMRIEQRIDLHTGRQVRHLEQLLEPGRLSERPALPLPEAPRLPPAAVYAAARAQVLRTLGALANARGRELGDRSDLQISRMRQYYADLRGELEEQGKRGRAADASSRVWSS